MTFLIIIGPGHIYAWQTASAVTPDSTHLIHAILAGWGILACMQLLLNYAALYTNNIIIIIVSLHCTEVQNYLQVLGSFTLLSNTI